MNNPRRIGPTGYFSSCGLWNRQDGGQWNVTVEAKFKFHVSNEFHLSWRMRFSFASMKYYLLTRDLGTFPLVVTFWLCFSLATRIRCFAGIFEDFLIVIKLLQDQVQPNHNKAKLKRKRRNESHSMWRKTFPTRCLIGADSSRDTKDE